MDRLPSYTLRVFTGAADSDRAAIEAAEVFQKVFDALSRRGFGSYIELDNPDGVRLVGNATEAPA
jgi:hypothetical protein